MNKYRLTILIALLGSFSTLSQADTDGKTYPGAMCRQVNTQQLSVIRDSGGGIFNDSFSTTKVVCPVIHDDLTRKNIRKIYAMIDFARVNVVDNNSGSGKDVKCKINSNRIRKGLTDFNFRFVREFDLSIGASPETQSLDMIYKHHPLWTYDSHSVEIECNLPPAQLAGRNKRRSGIRSYRIYEKDQSNR